MARGIAVKLLPPAYVRAYVRRCDAIEPIRRTRCLLEASRCSDLHTVPVKSVEQQALQGLHHPLAVDEQSHGAHQHAARVVSGVRAGSIERFASGGWIDRPSWLTGNMPERDLPAVSSTRTLATTRLPPVAMGTALTQIP